MHVLRTFLASLVLSGSAVAAPFAYVPNEGSGNVSVIDTANDRVTRTITVGGKPRGIAIAPDGKRLFLSDQTANGLAVIDKFKSQGVKIETRESPGGHTWDNWRLYLFEVAPKLFR